MSSRVYGTKNQPILFSALGYGNLEATTTMKYYAFAYLLVSAFASTASAAPIETDTGNEAYVHLSCLN